MSLDLDLNYLENNFKVDKSSNNRVYQFEEFMLDAAHLMLSRNGEEIPLVPRAVETLRVLVERRGEILSKTELMDAIWTDSIVEESNLAQYLHILRKTLGKQQNGQPFIETLRRRGYRFNGNVEVVENSITDAAKNNGAQISTPEPAASETALVNRPLYSTSATSPPRVLRVERHGNVLALADWKEPAAETERAAYANVVRPASGSDSKLPNKRLYAAALIISTLLLGTLTYLWFRSNSAQTAIKDDVVFLNLTNGEDVNFATISPNGDYFVYASIEGSKSRLMLQQTGQPSAREISDAFEGSLGGTNFTPDSQFVYFVIFENGTGTLYRIPTFGGARTKILSGIAGMPSFSPDGSEMVFMRGNSEGSMIIIAASDGSRERKVLSFTKQDLASLYGGGAWSPDGKTIAYGVVDLKRPHKGGCTIMGIDPITQEKTPLSPDRWDTCYRMEWTRDSQGLVFIGSKEDEAFSTRRDQIYYLSIPDQTSRRLTTDGARHDVLSLGVTDKDEMLAVSFNRISQVWSMETGGDSRNAVQITQGHADGRGGIAPLNDGRVAYLTRNGDGFSVWTMNSDGSNRKQLLTDPPAIEELRSPPDGSFFVFSGKRDGWNHLYRVDADGGNLRQLTFGESMDVDSTVSPDGNWIVYSSHVYSDGIERSALWKVSSEGGEPTRLTDADCSNPHFSPDGSSVSCVSQDWKTISMVSAGTGKILKTFKTEANPVLNVGARWTPDGKAIAYIVSSKLVGNILVQPVDGGAVRPLTEFKSGDIYNFAFSSDGTSIYLARGYQIKKAVLITNFR